MGNVVTLDPLPVDLERVEDRVDVALRIRTLRPVPDLGDQGVVLLHHVQGGELPRTVSVPSVPRGVVERDREAGVDDQQHEAGAHGTADPPETADRSRPTRGSGRCRRPAAKAAVREPQCPSLDATSADHHESRDGGRLAVLPRRGDEARRGRRFLHVLDQTVPTHPSHVRIG